MKIDVGAPVVVEAGVDNRGFSHVSVPAKTVSRGLGRRDRVTLEWLIGQAGVWPLEWRSLCGVTGVLVLYRGAVRDLTVCPECRALSGLHVSAVPDPVSRRALRRLQVAA